MCRSSKCFYSFRAVCNARVAELADAPDLGSEVNNFITEQKRELTINASSRFDI